MCKQERQCIPFMNAKSQEIRTLNQILKKSDILTRYRLLQLWMIDVFTQSCMNESIDVKHMIEALTCDNVNVKSDVNQTQVEAIYATLNVVKKNLCDINVKLNQTLQHVKQQAFIDTLLMKILDEPNAVEPNDVDEHTDFTTKVKALEDVIHANEQRIQRLSEMSEAKISTILNDINVAHEHECLTCESTGQ